MGDHHQRFIFFARERNEQFQNVRARFRVEIACRFVGENQFRVRAQRARDGDALLFAARKFIGKNICAFAQTHRVEQTIRLRVRVTFFPAREFGGHQHIFADGERGNEIKKLKYESDVLAPKQRAVMVIQFCNVRRAKKNIAARWRVESREQIEQCTLAAATASDNRDEFAARDFRIHALQDRALLFPLVKLFRDVFKTNQRVFIVPVCDHAAFLCEILHYCSPLLCCCQIIFLTSIPLPSSAILKFALPNQTIYRKIEICATKSNYRYMIRIFSTVHLHTQKVVKYRALMSTTLLRTKYTLPPLRSSLIARPRLIERLDRARFKPLTIVTAAAGFGKTTLVREWCAQQASPCAWFSLDADDNDPARFLAYLLAALQVVYPTLGENLDVPLQAPLVSTQDVLAHLINEWSAHAAEIFLVLDDYHWIENESLNTALEFFIEHLPAHAHVLVTTRLDPPWALARWRVRNQLNELRASDLRWTTNEAAQFFGDAMALQLTDAQIEKLQTRTEGWIAGLQLAALALAERANVAEFIESFSGSQRYIITYLAEEVLKRQPPALETFLEQTSILERFNAELCHALTNANDAQTQLNELYERNLFLIPLDEQGEWYRYHFLFAEVLRARLKQKYGAQKIFELHQAASAWFEKNNFTNEAIQHALDAHAWEHVARLMETQTEQSLRRAELTTLERWLAAFPAERLEHDPRLLLVQALVLTLRAPFQFARIEELVTRAQAALEPDDAETRELHGRLLAVACMNASNQTNTARTIDLAERALRDLAPTSLFWRAMTQINMGIAYGARGEPRGASDALQAGIHASNQVDALYLGLFGRMHLGNVRVMQGARRAARDIFVNAIADAEAHNLERTPLAGYLYSGYGKLEYEWNELAESRAMLERARERIGAEARPWAAFDIEMDMARIALAQDDADGVRAILTHLTQFLENAKLEPLWLAFRAWQARAALRQGNDAQAVKWAERTDSTSRAEIPLMRELEELTRVRVWIQQGRTREAEELLKQIADSARANGRDATVIECEMLSALTFARAQNKARSFTHLHRALEMAHAENFVRLFVDEGEAMRKMLRDWSANRGRFEEIGDLDLRDYAEKLSGMFGERDSTNALKSKIRNQKSEMLTEPLSERELQVLLLIASGASNQQIADKLVIALPTVKRHISNIYGKLQVTSRTQALVRARELKLI